MQANTDMKNKISKIILLLVKIFFGFVAALFLIWFVLFLNNRHNVFGQCVKLPNGMVVAREAYFNFSDTYFTPTVVVKGPDGTEFSRGNDEIFYFSATTAWWVDYYSETKSDGLAYRPDASLVHRSENRDLRNKLISEAGELLEEGKTIKNTNILGIWTYLRKHPKYLSLI